MSGKDTNERRFCANRQSQELPQLFSETIFLRRDAPQSAVRIAENISSHERTSNLIAIIDEILLETSSRDLMNFGSRRERLIINTEIEAIRELRNSSTMTSLERVSKSNTRYVRKRYFSENDLSFVSRDPHDQAQSSIANTLRSRSTRIRSRISVTLDWDDDAQTI
jgi:hypothetical protein